MKLTKIKTTMMAGVVAASMLMPGMTAMAASTAVPTIDKTVTANSAISTIPSADQGVTFKITQIDNADGIAAPGNITLDNDGVKTVTVDKSGTFNTTNFLSDAEVEQLQTGEYTFHVEETTTVSGSDFGWVSVSDAKYDIQVTVKNDGTIEYQAYDPADKTSKKTSLAFSNTYNKKSTDEDGEVNSLTITKTVENGDFVPSDTTYPITVVITPPTEQLNVTEGTSYTYTSSDTDATWKYENGKVYITANLTKDGTIVVSNMAVGASYTVSEDTTAIAGKYGFDADSSTLTADGNVAEADATADIVNVFNKPENTGIVTSIAPYVTLVVLAVAAVAAYMAMKSRVAR